VNIKRAKQKHLIREFATGKKLINTETVDHKLSHTLQSAIKGQKKGEAYDSCYIVVKGYILYLQKLWS